MKKTFAFIFVLIGFFANGQTDSLLMTSLRSKSKSSLDSFISQHRNYYQAYYREIINGYFEAEYSIDTEDKPYNFTTVEIIYKDAIVLGYNYKHEERNDVVDQNQEFVTNSKEFCYWNSDDLDLMLQEFENAFGKKLNYFELFNPVLFGESVGYEGGPPEGEIQLRELIEDRNRLEMVNMLGSSRLETQLYAVKGLRELQDKGIELTGEELKMMLAILKKKGKVHHANGCSIEFDDVEEIIETYGLLR